MITISKKSHKQLIRTVWLFAFLPTALCVFLVVPLSILAQSNVVYADTVIPFLLEILTLLLTVVPYAVCFPCIALKILADGLKTAWGMIGIYAGNVFFHYLANFGVTALMDGSLPIGSIPYLLVYIVSDLLMLAFVLLFTVICTKKYRRRRADMLAAASRLGRRPEEKPLLPITALFARNNPLQSSLLFIGIVAAAFRVISRLFYDLYIGLPTSVVDLLWIIISYTLDLLIGFSVYFVAILVVNRFFASQQTDTNQKQGY